MRRGVQSRDYTCARPYRAGVGARRTTLTGVRRGRCHWVGLSIRTRVDLKHYLDGTRPAHQYPFCVGQVREAFRHNTNHVADVAMYRFPRSVKRGRAVGPVIGHVLDIYAPIAKPLQCGRP